MRFIVILGRVLDPRGIAVNRRAGRIFVNREAYILQPADRCALEAALRLKDAGEVEVLALQRSPLPNADVLRWALATGADRAIYLTGDELVAADDSVMACVLAAVVGRLGEVDLILTGATTLDTNQSQLGPRVAAALDWPQIVNAWGVDVADRCVRAICQNEGRYDMLEADLPAVVTVLPGALEPRYPDGVRLVNVFRGDGELAAGLSQWDVGDLVAPEALRPSLRLRGPTFPPERERGVRVSGPLGEMVQSAVDALKRSVSTGMSPNG